MEKKSLSREWIEQKVVSHCLKPKTTRHSLPQQEHLTCAYSLKIGENNAWETRTIDLTSTWETQEPDRQQKIICCSKSDTKTPIKTKYTRSKNYFTHTTLVKTLLKSLISTLHHRPLITIRLITHKSTKPFIYPVSVFGVHVMDLSNLHKT